MVKQYRIYCSIFLVLTLNGLAQDSSRSTQLLILGVIHTGNKVFDQKELYKTINRFQPDLILDEAESDFRYVFGLRTARFLGIWRPSIEQVALQRYHSRNRKVPILAFDTSFNRHAYLKRSDTLSDVFFRDLSAASLDHADRLFISGYLEKSQMYRQVYMNKSLCEINKAYVFQHSASLNEMDSSAMLPIGEKYIKDYPSFKAYKEHVYFWMNRNAFMVRKVKSYIDYFKPKRLLVITGLSHKYYLVNRLKEYSPVKMVELDCE